MSPFDASNDLGLRRSMYIMGSGQPQDTKHNATHATKIITSNGCHLPHKWPFVSTHSLRGMHSISQNLVYCATQQHQKPPIHRHYIPQVGDGLSSEMVTCGHLSATSPDVDYSHDAMP